MTVQVENLTIYQGSTYTQPFRFWADSANTVPLSLTGATAAMKARRGDKDGNLLFSLTSSDGLTINTVASTITVTLPAATSAAITKTLRGDDTIEGVYDMEVTIGGVVTRVLEGSVTISREVTR